mmetsp:Transcript_9204/g.30356  ORF Transcript_9204/g.30356 Transcript_9204/m.30356 type:complete len:390 (-) Transcript_9204:1183-2352(-)
MSSDLYAEACDALLDEEWALALEKLSALIDGAPANASFLEQRAAVHLKLNDATAAIQDATAALEIDPRHRKALLRKGIAAFALEEFETALAAFKASYALDNSSANRTWIRKCEVELAEEAVDNGGSSSSTMAPPERQAPSAPAPVQPAGPVYRHQWYQTQAYVTVEVLAKGVPAEAASLDVDDHSVTIRIAPLDDRQEYALTLWLYEAIDPEASKVSVGTNKVTVKLKKREQIEWSHLERKRVVPGSDKIGGGSIAATSTAAAKDSRDASSSSAQPAAASASSAKAAASAQVVGRGAVPAPGKKAYADWDRIEQDLDAEEKDEKLEGDAALNKLFQDIYKNADESTRRAMNKSFVESNGTVLSTNWSEIGNRYTEGSPPEGMESKRYEY